MALTSAPSPRRRQPESPGGQRFRYRLACRCRTRLYDGNRKKDVYQSFGIGSYWIVEPDRKRPELTVFELRDGRYAEVAHVTVDEEFRAERPFNVTIVASALMALP